MTIDAITRAPRAQRISAAVGVAAAAVAVGLALTQPQQATAPAAHAKFDVVTVVARPSATSPATVTETDKPHELQVTKATPQIRAAHTVIADP